MRLLLALLLFAFAPGCGDSGAGLADAAAPDLALSRITSITVHYPNAAKNNQKLTIRGDGGGLNWNTGTPMTAAADGWRFSIVDLDKPLEFKPLLDDMTWSRGANDRVQPDAIADVYPHFNTPKGRVFKLIASFHSNVLGNDRGVWAYLPPSYDENPEATYPVLYMHDGQNLFDPLLAFGGNEWMVDETLDAGADVLDRAQSIREVIVIGIANTAERTYEYTPTRDA